MKEITILAMLLFAGHSWAESKSVYTDLDKSCKVFEEDGEAPHSRSNCGSVGGYTLIREWDDERNSLTLKRGGKEMALNLSHMGSGGFNTIQGKVEWRIDGQEPYALIARMTWDNESKAGKLLVIRLNPAQVCLLEMVDASNDKHANETARKIADNKQRTCSKKL